jgi:hypothetical protein
VRQSIASHEVSFQYVHLPCEIGAAMNDTAGANHKCAHQQPHNAAVDHFKLFDENRLAALALRRSFQTRETTSLPALPSDW